LPHNQHAPTLAKARCPFQGAVSGFGRPGATDMLTFQQIILTLQDYWS
jgi:hypothetical protein